MPLATSAQPPPFIIQLFYCKSSRPSAARRCIVSAINKQQRGRLFLEAKFNLLIFSRAVCRGSLPLAGHRVRRSKREMIIRDRISIREMDGHRVAVDGIVRRSPARMRRPCPERVNQKVIIYCVWLGGGGPIVNSAQDINKAARRNLR